METSFIKLIHIYFLYLKLFAFILPLKRYLLLLRIDLSFFKTRSELVFINLIFGRFVNLVKQASS